MKGTFLLFSNGFLRTVWRAKLRPDKLEIHVLLNKFHSIGHEISRDCARNVFIFRAPGPSLHGKERHTEQNVPGWTHTVQMNTFLKAIPGDPHYRVQFAIWNL